MSNVQADRSKVTRLVSIVQGGGMAEFRRQKCGSGETRRMSPVSEANSQAVCLWNLISAGAALASDHGPDSRVRVTEGSCGRG